MPRLIYLVRIPLRLPSMSNQHLHWPARHRQAKQQRSIVYYALRAEGGLPGLSLPLHVTLTRCAPRRLDDDNLRGALKACRDGVADWIAERYGIGQDTQAGLSWGYAQCPQSGPPALELQLHEGEED